MANALLMVWTTAAPTVSDAEFFRWYDDEHIPQVRAAIPTISAVNRYQVVGETDSTPPEGRTSAAAARYLTIYEIEDGNVDEARETLFAAVSDGSITPSTTIDREVNPPALQFYRNTTQP